MHTLPNMTYSDNAEPLRPGAAHFSCCMRLDIYAPSVVICNVATS